MSGTDSYAGKPRLRVAAHVRCFDDTGRMLLARWQGPDGPRWTTPGGGLDVGEQPAHAAVREVAEETGYEVALDGLAGTFSQHFVGHQGVDWHAVVVVYDAHVTGGALRFETHGSTDRAAWVPADEVPRLEAVPLVAAVRGLGPGGPLRPTREGYPVTPAAPEPGGGGSVEVRCELPAGAGSTVEPVRAVETVRAVVPHGQDPRAVAVGLASRALGAATVALVDAASELADVARPDVAGWTVLLTYAASAAPLASAPGVARSGV